MTKTNVKKRIVTIVLLLFSVMLLFACEKKHVCEFEYYDNGNDTHTKTCLTNSNHMETEEHSFDSGIVLIEPTDISPGKIEYKCVYCDYKTIKKLNPLGEHEFNKTIIDEKFLKEKISDATSIYYKSCECGAYGNDNHLFEDSVVPSDYIEIEYIESNGYQYINTGYIPTDKTGYYVNYSLTNYSSSVIFGHKNFDDLGVYLTSNSAGSKFTWNESVFNKSLSIIVGEKISQSINYLNNRKIYFNNVLVTEELEEFLGPSVPVYLFALNSNNVASNYSRIRLYSFKITENDKIVRNFIPVLKEETNEIGLFDIVENKFYDNDFYDLNESNENLINCEEYTQLEYLPFNGQLFKTGIIGEAVWHFDIMFANTKTRQLMGYGATGCEFWGVFNTGYYGIHKDYAITDIKVGRRDYIIHNYEKSYFLKINNYELPLVKTDVSEMEYKIGNLSSSSTFACTFYLYNVKAYQNGKLVRDYVPCYKLSENSYGLYDLVSGEFSVLFNYYNFKQGKMVGHNLDGGTVITETEPGVDGHIVYTCTTCGREFHKYLNSYSYIINFNVSDNVKVKVFKDNNPNEFKYSLTGYSVNKYTYNYSRVNAILVFELEINGGYELDNFEFDTKLCEINQIFDNVYIIENIKGHIEIKVNLKQK